MLDDPLYQYLSNLPISLYAIPFLYTAFVFIIHFLVIVRNTLVKSISKHRLSNNSTSIKIHYQNPLSWAWPLFVVLPISLIYISSHLLIQQLDDSLALTSYLFISHSSLINFFRVNISYGILLASVGFALRAFLVPLKHRLWFNESYPIRIIIVILTDFILAYLSLIAIVSLLFTSVVLFFYLGDNTVVYNFWHPDFNYGLLTTQNFLTYLFFIAIVFSLLPLVMIIPSIRKSQSVCPPIMYYALTATALTVVGLLLILLVPQYNKRVDQIKQAQFKQIIQTINPSSAPSVSDLKLQTYILMKNLDNQYHVPFIFSSVIALRGVYFLLEVHSNRLQKSPTPADPPDLLFSILHGIKKWIQELA